MLITVLVDWVHVILQAMVSIHYIISFSIDDLVYIAISSQYHTYLPEIDNPYSPNIL